MTPAERIAALADIIASQEDPDPGCGCETCAWNNNLNWLLRVARAAVEWAERSRNYATDRDAVAVIAAVYDAPEVQTCAAKRALAVAVDELDDREGADA